MSDVFKEYKIPHAGLKKEVHEFSYELDEKFFANFEHALIDKCTIQVNVKFDKRHDPYTIEVDLDGTIWGDCDRCTATLPLTIHTSFIIYVKYIYDEALKEVDDVEIIYIAKDDPDIDITQFIYDYVQLSVPAHKICDNPGQTEYCDKDIIRILEQGSTDESTDPRWADLNKVKDKLN